MKICDLFSQKKAVYSFEIFPPKPTTDLKKTYDTIAALRDLSPDYISVTYSAGGSKNTRTAEIAGILKHEYGIEPLAHLTCINSTRQDVDEALSKLDAVGVENILTLRGDRVPGAECTDFAHASELAAYVKSKGNYSLSGACYPEGHPECDSMVSDIRNLKKKVDAGIGHLNSQLFYDNEDYFRFLDMVRLAGIEVPIEAGIMPLTKQSQVERTIAMTGVKIPAKISRMVAKFSDKSEALREAGIAYASDQIIDLLSAGVQGIHLYVMNDAYVARRITENIKGVLGEVNED